MAAGNDTAAGSESNGGSTALPRRSGFEPRAVYPQDGGLQRAWRRLSRRRAATLCLVAVLTVGIGGCGAAPAATASASAGKSAEKKEPENAFATIDLGEFSLRQTRPLEESTLHLRFRAHATATADNVPRLEHLLARHEHQVREQVIIAARTAETWEFDEPELARLRRRIQLRLNRWVDANLVKDVVLTDFRFRMD